jgi:hypothetical protein
MQSSRISAAQVHSAWSPSLGDPVSLQAPSYLVADAAGSKSAATDATAWRGVAWRGVAWRGIDRQKYQNAAGGREGPARSSSERGAGRRGPAGAKTSFKITNKDDKETMDIKKIKCIYIFRFPLR